MRLTLSLLMVTVASATLRATGVQSSLLEELIKLSMAPFSMSMPEAQDVKERNTQVKIIPRLMLTTPTSLWTPGGQAVLQGTSYGFPNKHQPLYSMHQYCVGMI